MAEGQPVPFQMPAPGSQGEAMVMAELARRHGWIPQQAYGAAEVARETERERARVLAAAEEKAREAKSSDQEWGTYLVDDIANPKSVQGNPKQVGLQDGNRIPESRGRRGGGGHGNDAGYVSLSGLDITDSSWPLGELLRRPEMRGKPSTRTKTSTLPTLGRRTCRAALIVPVWCFDTQT
eukprot:CAMPEP_0182904882 /NCGR_PEP_ID=MMETSP0034_2-20130328/32468_1 /TAXON_ID=156128 /ORGANISM="Nephroselmis pyriformis, Strain CCMP717" /LENGTH=179 /DNA_ID=CAMNT_0025040131 /DNA_START=379 /DNA_END=915 /DNA_ORIENTATION=+